MNAQASAPQQAQDSQKHRFSSFLETYQISVEIAGEHAPVFKKSLLFYAFSYIAQGLAFSCFYPLLSTIFEGVFDLNNSLYWFAIMLLLSIVSLIFRWFALNFDFGGTINITHDLRMALGKKIRSMPLQRLYKYRTGEVNAIIAGDVDDSVLHMGSVAGMILEIMIVPTVIVATTFFIDWRMALAILLVLPFSVPIYNWTRKMTVESKKITSQGNATLESDIIEYIQGLPVLRAINQVGVNAENLQRSIAKVKSLQKNALFAEILPFLLMTALIEFVFLLVLTLGALWIVEGSFTIAVLISLLIMIGRLLEPLSNFIAIAPVFDTIETGFRKIKTVLNIQELKIETPQQKATSFDIEFKKVDFNYLDYTQKALDNISFVIKNNSLTAIVGASGSGKTTITKLIMRYADPSNGEVSIGGVNIKNMTAEALMSNISVVFQDVYLFDDTILNNIRMGKPDASDDEVIKSAESAYCHEFILRLPKGYETKVGEIGGSLSGGEKQRISIARAILKNSKIVILDEPTSALDTQSEVAVQQALDSLIKDKTVIVIAHRLSTIAHANTILVIEEGRLKEQGTHRQLLAKKGKYNAMYQAQQRIKKWNLS